MSYQCPWEAAFCPPAGRCAEKVIELPRMPAGQVLGIYHGGSLADVTAQCGGLVCASCALCQTCGRFSLLVILAPAGEVPARVLRPCGTEAAYKRHRRHGEIPCDDCYAGHSDYCKPYSAAQRARLRLAAAA